MTKHLARAGALALCAGTLALLVGCSSAEEQPTSRGASRSPAPPGARHVSAGSPVKGATPNEKSIPAASVKDAAPIEQLASTVARLPLLTNGINSGIVAVSGNDVLISSRRFVQSLHPVPTQLSLWRMATGGLVKVADIPMLHPGGDTDGVATPVLTDEYVVWMEDDQNDLNVDPWHLIVYSRRTGVTKEIASAPRMDDGNLPLAPPAWTGPQVQGRRVYWAQTGGTMGHEHSDIFGCTITACHPAKLISGAAHPAVAAGALYAIRWSPYAGRAPEPSFSVVRSDGRTPDTLTTVAKVPITVGSQAPFGLAAGRGVLAWIIDGQTRDRVVLHDLGTDLDTAFTSDGNSGFGYPVVTGRAVLWARTGDAATGGSGYLYDRKTRRIMRLGNATGLRGMGGSGDLLYWEVSNDAPNAQIEDLQYVIARFKH